MLHVAEQESTTVNEELLEAQIVAQAITELQEIQAPSTQVSLWQYTGFI